MTDLSAEIADLAVAAREADPVRFDWVRRHRPVDSVEGMSDDATVLAIKLNRQWAREVGVDDGLDVEEMQRRHDHWMRRVRSVTTP